MMTIFMMCPFHPLAVHKRRPDGYLEESKCPGPGLSLHVPEPHNERLLDFILERRSGFAPGGGSGFEPPIDLTESVDKANSRGC
jgi:hypothetical protein